VGPTSFPLPPVAELALALGIVLVVVWRQLVAQPADPRSLFLLPGLLTLVGLWQLAQSPPHALGAASLLVAQLAAGVVVGAARGATMRLWTTAAGVPMRRGTPLTLLLWLATLGVRVPLAAAGYGAGAPRLAEVLLALGATLLAQNLVVWARAVQRGGPAVSAPVQS
jgi:hypothetical protein